MGAIVREEAYSGDLFYWYFKWKSKFVIVLSLHKYYFPKCSHIDVTK